MIFLTKYFDTTNVKRMSHKLREAVYGWIRQNYDGSLLDDIADIIYQFYLIKIESNILSSDEQISLFNLLFNQITKHEDNKDMKSIETKLLYRGSVNGFSAATFHEICDEKGPTLTVIHNEHDHIFGGYANKSWNWKMGYISDKKAFLWMVRPTLKVFGFRKGCTEGENALWNSKYDGPRFGRGHDLWIGNEAKNNGCFSHTFEFNPKEMSGKTDWNEEWESLFDNLICNFDIKDYEVFSVSCL